MHTRPLLAPTDLTDPARAVVEKFHPDIVLQVKDAIVANKVVIVGMRFNDACTRARALFREHGVPFVYLEFGGYFSQWRRRLALKMWTGWPTFPMIFVAGKLVGGRADAAKAFDDGTIPALLASP